MGIKNKRGMELAISTIILMVIGIILLIGLVSIIFMGWDDFKTAISAALGSDMAKAQRACKLQCATDNSVDFCANKTVGTETLKCTDARIKLTDCSLTCP